MANLIRPGGRMFRQPQGTDLVLPASLVSGVPSTGITLFSGSNSKAPTTLGADRGVVARFPSGHSSAVRIPVAAGDCPSGTTMFLYGRFQTAEVDYLYSSAMGRGDSGGYSLLAMLHHHGSPSFRNGWQVSDGGGWKAVLYTEASVPLRWTLWSATRTSTGLYIYKDGKLDGFRNDVGSRSGYATDLGIGAQARPGGSYDNYCDVDVLCAGEISSGHCDAAWHAELLKYLQQAYLSDAKSNVYYTASAPPAGWKPYFAARRSRTIGAGVT